MTPDLAAAIRQSAARLGADPVDLGTVISYETAGTFDPWKAGPTTQWGQHRGLIQWGEPQREQYGVHQGMPVDQQMRAVEKYLTNAGFKPGMGLLDMYSAVNAGAVGRYGASDANNGGAPGTVRDKVMNQMGDHRAKAAAFLGMPAGGTGGLSYGAAQPQMAAPSAIFLADMFATPEIAPVAEDQPLFAEPARGRETPEQELVRRQALLSDLGSFFG